MADNPSAFHNLKHSKWLLMLVKAMYSPVSIPLADAMLEEKRRQLEEVKAVKEMALRHAQRRGDKRNVTGKEG